MTIQPIRLAGDPILRMKCQQVTEFMVERTRVNDLRDTLMDFIKRVGYGRGIAAPQIGITKRIIYLSAKEYSGELINPKIISHGKRKFDYWDSCFSFKAAFFAKVRRWEEIDVEYSDLNGKVHRIEARDPLFSELLQHEIDHLDGILFVDRMVRKGGRVNVMMNGEWEKHGRPFRE